VLLVLGITGYLFSGKKETTSQRNNVIVPSTTITPKSIQSPNELSLKTLQLLQNRLNNKNSIKNEEGMLMLATWVDIDGFKIPLKYVTFSLIPFPEITPLPLPEITEKLKPGDAVPLYITDFQTKIKNFFNEQGFILSEKNIFDSRTNKEYQDYSGSFGGLILVNGFSKDDTYCKTIIGLETDKKNSAAFSCGVIDKEAATLKKEFVKAINPSNDQVTDFRIDKISGNYAIGSFGSLGGAGSTWIAMKDTAGWKKIMTLQQPPFCTEVDKYQVPKEIYENCYTDKTGTLRFKEGN
jgi:hypothetical protein